MVRAAVVVGMGAGGVLAVSAVTELLRLILL